MEISGANFGWFGAEKPSKAVGGFHSHVIPALVKGHTVGDHWGISGEGIALGTSTVSVVMYI